MDRVRTRRCLCRTCGGNDSNLSDNILEDGNGSDSEMEEISPPVGIRYVEPIRPYSQRRPPRRQPPPPLPPALPTGPPVLLAPMPNHQLMPMAMAFPYGYPMTIPGPPLGGMEQMQAFRDVQLQRMQQMTQNENLSQEEEEEMEDCIASV